MDELAKHKHLDALSREWVMASEEQRAEVERELGNWGYQVDEHGAVSELPEVEDVKLSEEDERKAREAAEAAAKRSAESPSKSTAPAERRRVGGGAQAE